MSFCLGFQQLVFGSVAASLQVLGNQHLLLGFRGRRSLAPPVARQPAVRGGPADIAINTSTQ